MTSTTKTAIAIAAAALCAAAAAGQTTVRLDPQADATVRSDQPTTNYGTSAELGLAKDRGPAGIYFMRTFFRFDTTPLLGQPIRSAVLYFNETRTIAAGALPVTVYRLTQPFNESTVTWANKPADDGKAVVSVPVGDNFNRGWKPFDITAVVQDWARGATNHGVVIRLASESTAGAYRPAWGPSREHATAADRPHLLVDTSAAVPFDKGCGPVATWPRLGVTSGTPKLGTQMTVTGTLLAPASNGLTVAGLSNTTWAGVKLPLMLDPRVGPACQLLVSLDLLLGGTTDSTGQQHLSFGVPNDPRIVGIHVYLQMATLGPTNHFTEGLDLLIH